jgi:hypothetical protein
VTGIRIRVNNSRGERGHFANRKTVAEVLVKQGVVFKKIALRK